MYEACLEGIQPCNMKNRALAGVAQWMECQAAKQRVTSLIPIQDTCLGFGPGP